MSYHGILTPDRDGRPGYIWWIGNSPSQSWSRFFAYPDRNGELNNHRAPLGEAIAAYEAIGYRCVELDVSVKAATGGGEGND